MDYKVYWLGAAKHPEFTDYDEALEYAQTMTFEESTLNTAVIVERTESLRIKRVIIVTWFFDALWTVEHIKY